MLDITDELKALVNELNRHQIEYALCGGLAMGVHGRTRATVDIDLLILSESLWKRLLRLLKARATTFAAKR